MNRKKMRLMPRFCTLAKENSFSECTHCCMIRFVAENWKRFFIVIVQKQDINNSLRKHKHNYAEEYSCNLLETEECKFSPGFLDKNRGIRNDRWRMKKSTSKNFFDSFLFVLVCRRMKSCSVITQSILFNIPALFVCFYFIS